MTTRAALFARLDALGIAHRTHDHPAVFTVAESRLIKQDLPGGHTKNLFVKDKKGRIFLVVAVWVVAQGASVRGADDGDFSAIPSSATYRLAPLNTSSLPWERPGPRTRHFSVATRLFAFHRRLSHPRPPPLPSLQLGLIAPNLIQSTHTRRFRFPSAPGARPLSLY